MQPDSGQHKRLCKQEDGRFCRRRQADYERGSVLIWWRIAAATRRCGSTALPIGTLPRAERGIHSAPARGILAERIPRSNPRTRTRTRMTAKVIPLDLTGVAV